MYINDALDWTGKSLVHCPYCVSVIHNVILPVLCVFSNIYRYKRRKTLTGVHQKRFEYILKIAGRESSSIEVLNEANVVLMFLIKVSDYKDLWIQTVGQGGSSAAECLQATAKLLVTVPRLFNDTKLNNSTADDTQNERISLEYIRILISSFQILSKFSAPIMQILLDEGIDSGQYQNILQPSLQPAQIGEMPTFGSCLSCLSLGVMFLGKTGGEIITKPDIVLLIDQVGFQTDPF